MKKKRLLALGLAVALAFPTSIQSVEAADYSSTNVVTEIPGADREFFDVNNSSKEDWFNVTGYVAGNIGDRSQYYDEYVSNGYKDTAAYKVVEEDGYVNADGDYITAEAYAALDAAVQADYEAITAEEQFINALASGASVIQVNALELEMGYKYLDNMGINRRGVVEPVTDYDKGNEPITNPILMERGVSDIALNSHMTIFSTTGCTIRHAGIDVGGCDDVVVRNFKFEGMYEWDDVPVGQENNYTGGRKRYGWCYVSGNDSDNIWIDHCTFGFTFDGNIDIKNGSSISITWCQIGVQDISKGSELWQNIEYMEEQYQSYKAGTGGAQYYIYSQYRDKLAEKGYSSEEAVKMIVDYAALHSKVHLVGSGEDSFYTNVDEKMTLAFNYYENIMQRIPMVRQGNAHMFNCIVDNTRFNTAVTLLRSAGVGTNYWASARCINARDGASIGADTCIFVGVNPLTGAEYQGDDLANVNDDWKKLVTPMVNHFLIVNSSVTNNSGETYVGSSWDKNGENAFTGDITWGDKASIGNFKWSKWKNQDQFLNAQGYGDESLLKKYTGNYYEDFYEGSDDLGYDYKLFTLEDTETMVKAYSGAQANLFDEATDETNTVNYVSPYTKQYVEENYGTKVVVDVAGGEITGKVDNTYYLPNGESVTLPGASEVTKEGYTLAGWKEGTYVDGELVLGDIQTEVTITGGDTFTTKYYFAVWEISKYTLTYDSMGGSQVAPVTNVPHGSTITDVGGFPADPTRTDFTFQGWYSYTPESGYGAKVYANSIIKADTTLYAKWRPTKVDVIFNTNGGSEVATIEDVTYNTAVTLPEAPTKDGYEFAGWYYDEALTKEFTESTKIVEKLSLDLNLYGSLTLYAKWTEVSEVTLSFETNGGTTAEAITVVPGEAVGELPIPTKAEYVFAGWYTDDTYTTEFTTASAIDVDTTIYAKWAAKGDMNQDNLVNANDALMILKYAANMLGEDEVTELKLKQADVEGTDGKVNANDALAILKYVANIITGFDS